MDTKNTTFDDAVDQTDNITNSTYNDMMSNQPKENYNEFDVYIDWETGTKHTLGIDDNQMPHLISSEPANIIDKGQKAIADAGEAQVIASEATIEANQKLWEGAKNFFVRAPKDYWTGIKRTALKMNDSAIQAADFLTGGNYSILNKSISGETYYRNDDLDMTLTMRGEVLVDGSFENSATDPQYMNGGQFSAFDINGTLKDGWKEITLPMKRLQESEYDYENEGFGMPVLMEYGIQYGLPGVQMYKLLGKVPYLNTWGRVILAELGTEFVGATQDEEDINMANMIISFGYSEEDSQTVLRELLDAVAADIDDTAFERKIKNAVGNAPIGVGFAGVLQAFKFMKAFKNNKEGRKIVAEELGLKYKADDGEEGVFKILDADDNPIASVGTQEEADEILSILGKGYKVQEFKSVGAAVNTNAALKTDTPDFYSNVVNAINTLNISEKGMPGNQILATIINTQGVKQIEIDDMGLEEFLKDKPNVTKTELDAFVEKKALTNRISTTMLEEETDVMTRKLDYDSSIAPDGSIRILFDKNNITNLREATEMILNSDKFSKDLEKTYNQYVKDMEIDAPPIFGDVDWMKGEYNGVVQRFLNERGIYAPTPIKPVFAYNQNYNIAGGTNPKEIIIHSSGNAQVYTRDHYRLHGTGKEVPAGENVLAHIRTNDRVIDGKKVLFIEEIQSDLHQTGRKEGYNIPSSPFGENIVKTGTVPNAPLKKNWYETAMKKAIKHAIDNGYDSIAFTPGSVQNQRYSLSTYVEDLIITPNRGSIKLSGTQKNGAPFTEHVNFDELDAQVGKETADKIRADNPNLETSIKKEQQLVIRLNKVQSKMAKISDLTADGKNPNKKIYPRATRNFYYKEEAPGLQVYYSYQTPIGYKFNGETVVRVNDYSVTTNRHMYDIDGGAPDDRIPGWRFEEKLQKIKDDGYKAKPLDKNNKEYTTIIQEQAALTKKISKLKKDNQIVYNNQDLEIGGEGMKGFYDKILPAFVKKFGKKYGVKVEYKSLEYNVEKPGGGTNIMIDENIKVPYFEIPESMKLDISEKGVPIANLKQNKEMTASSMA